MNYTRQSRLLKILLSQCDKRYWFPNKLSTQATASNATIVSLTYLRGLEVKQLDVEDLPEL